MDGLDLLRNNIHIRKATPADLDQLVKFEHQCFSSDRMSRRSYQTLLKKSSAEITIATLDGKIIGSTTVFYRKNSCQGRLYSIGIDAQYRQYGIATTLNHAIEKQAKQRNCDTILLEVRTDNAAAIQFYKKHGYELFGTYTHFYEDGTDALRMKKSL